MKIFLAGSTGVLGQRLLPLLLGAGHSVTAATRSPQKAEALRLAGASPVVLDALDRQAVIQAVTAVRPDAVVHQMTDLAQVTNLRNFDQEFASTNRLRTQGTDNLLIAARIAGAQRFVAQSYTGWPNLREGGSVKTEHDPLDTHPPSTMTQSLRAIHQLESTVAGASDLTGIVLRYGSFYGPGTALGAGGEFVKAVRHRKLPVIGNGAGVWSFIHIDDAARATLLAIESRQGGLFNIVDDDPAPVSEWLPDLARTLGVKAPLYLPQWLGRLIAGEAVVMMMTSMRGSSNLKAKQLLRWQPVYRTWREGFRLGLSSHPGIPAVTHA